MSFLPDFLFTPVLGTALGVWLLFLAFVGVLMALDLGVMHRGNKQLGIRHSLLLTAFYMLLAMGVGLWVWWLRGGQAGLEYYTGYFIEMALSVDNVFVISLIFGYFRIPPAFQYRALVWGILAVIVLRFVMIAAGAALVHRYEWVLYLFGAFLVFTGVKMLVKGEEEEHDMAKNPIVRVMSRWMRVTPDLDGEKFFVRRPDPKTGAMVLWATPLFLALAVINVADLVFAVDSVPAIFAITTDTYVVYTANIMAILGLRALYFALSAMVHRFEYLKYALALVLVFIGGKIFWNMLVAKVHPGISLGVTIGLIAGGVLFSLWKTARDHRHGAVAVPVPVPAENAPGEAASRTR